MGNNTIWLAPADVKEDNQQFAALGKYDGVFFYWKAVNADGNGLNVGFGWSIGPSEGANFAGFSSVHHGPTDSWGKNSETTEVFRTLPNRNDAARSQHSMQSHFIARKSGRWKTDCSNS